MGKFVIRQTNTGFKFDLKAANSEVIATSEVYTTKAACVKGAEGVAKAAPTANFADLTRGETAVNPKFELYEDKGGQFRFRLIARNGEIIAVSEAYTSRGGCENGIDSVRRNAVDAEIVEQ